MLWKVLLPLRRCTNGHEGEKAAAAEVGSGGQQLQRREDPEDAAKERGDSEAA